MSINNIIVAFVSGDLDLDDTISMDIAPFRGLNIDLRHKSSKSLQIKGPENF